MFFVNTHAILMTQPGQVAFAPAVVPAIEPTELLIASEYTCISPGTELRCLAGKEQNTVWPFVPGYAVVGRVVEAGAQTSTPVGTRVVCSGTRRADKNLQWGGHIGHVIMSESGAFPVPDSIAALDAATVNLAAIAYRGLRMSRVQPHEGVAVLGLGAIGQFAARLHHLTGARVYAADLNDARVAIAQQAGVNAFVPTGDLVEAFRERLPDGADVVVDATGVPQVAAQAIAIGREKPWSDVSPGPRLIIQGSYPESLTIPYQPAFRREMSVWFPRDQQAEDVRTILSLMARGLLRGADLIGTVEAPQNAAQVYEDVRTGKYITAAFRWSGD
jgi:2-desacetyl-2-hydroxyethyl bacteriochlorophyllide A dehydrogenase